MVKITVSRQNIFQSYFYIGYNFFKLFLIRIYFVNEINIYVEKNIYK